MPDFAFPIRKVDDDEVSLGWQDLIEELNDESSCEISLNEGLGNDNENSTPQKTPKTAIYERPKIQYHLSDTMPFQKQKNKRRTGSSRLGFNSSVESSLASGFEEYSSSCSSSSSSSSTLGSHSDFAKFLQEDSCRNIFFNNIPYNNNFDNNMKTETKDLSMKSKTRGFLPTDRTTASCGRAA